MLTTTATAPAITTPTGRRSSVYTDTSTTARKNSSSIAGAITTGAITSANTNPEGSDPPIEGYDGSAPEPPAATASQPCTIRRISPSPIPHSRSRNRNRSSPAGRDRANAHTMGTSIPSHSTPVAASPPHEGASTVTRVPSSTPRPTPSSATASTCDRHGCTVRPPSRQSVRRPPEDPSAEEDPDSTDVDAAARRSARVEPEPSPRPSPRPRPQRRARRSRR